MYGTSRAPYLSTRTLTQLALAERYPLASFPTLHHFYVDDLLSGAATEKAVELVWQLKEMMRKRGFNLRNRSPVSRTFGYLKSSELRTAVVTIVRLIQQTEFPNEIKCLVQGNPLPKDNKLLPLNLFCDSEGVLRVGGRFSRNTRLSYDQKHPMLLPKNEFTRKISSSLHAQKVSNLLQDESEIFSINRRFKSSEKVRGVVSARSTKLSVKGIEWFFIPPYTPHFGGLWESAIKSAKQLLIKATNSVLNFEECSILLIQIEACLNSRPITELSPDTSDFNALTPAHFLVGGPIHQFPEPSQTSRSVALSERWNLIQRLRQYFWDRWSTECLHRLQPRSKW
ncbi:reverse transcriptase domain-containing protein [Trichonephila inaurata madagascariensis]|uniref:Reverse transcriptase domain-containing protein n=1 Tax=Trichonephila inaurata madagascariensis TaxID=2747483 RepID=A0A8X6XN97_9ARAC|nr:reverse transcriptase domain-containing protein [Trichonephila inaurata madagascariensis]